MGLLLAAEIAVRVTRRPFQNFLAEQVFGPLKMSETSLGLGGRAVRDTMQCQVEQVSDWDWNSSYWRNLGAPWGGAHSTVHDVSTFVRYFANPDHALPQTGNGEVDDNESNYGTKRDARLRLEARTAGHMGA